MIYYIYFHSLSWEFRKKRKRNVKLMWQKHIPIVLNNDYFIEKHILSFLQIFFGGGDNSPKMIKTLFQINLDGLTHT